METRHALTDSTKQACTVITHLNNVPAVRLLQQINKRTLVGDGSTFRLATLVAATPSACSSRRTSIAITAALLERMSLLRLPLLVRARCTWQPAVIVRVRGTPRAPTAAAAASSSGSSCSTLVGQVSLHCQITFMFGVLLLLLLLVVVVVVVKIGRLSRGCRQWGCMGTSWWRHLYWRKRGSECKGITY